MESTEKTQVVQKQVNTPKTQIEHPSVTFHKGGRYLVVRPNDLEAVDALREIEERKRYRDMRELTFYGIEDPRSLETERIELWQCLVEDTDQHPFAKIFASYGIKVYVSPTLSNWAKKEARRQKIEATPFPPPPVIGDTPLFDRCCEGTILSCIKDYKISKSTHVKFKKGERYMVLSTGMEGRDLVVLGTNPVTSKATLSLVGQGARHEWTAFDPAMEEWFDDSEGMDVGKSILELYPKEVEAMRVKLKKLNLALYEHVEEDVCMAALGRGVINAYPMRMAKTSFAIAYAELVGSQKVAIVAPGNARIFWEKEFERLGFKQGKDFISIRSWEDTKSPAKYHLLSYPWLRQEEDKAWKARQDWKGKLKPSYRDVKNKETGEWDVVKLTNDCPHCKQHLQRTIVNDKGETVWTTDRGYRCLNKKCSWTTDSKKANGAAWQSKKPVKHTGGYIDYELAAHANCTDEKPKGRFCKECNIADAEWTPGRYKKLMKKYTLVIPDEIHNCKDDLTQSSKATFNLRARRRVGLTGTLISNSPMDAYWPLHYTQNAPNIQFPYFRGDGEKEFDTKFCDSVTLERSAGVETDKNGKQVQLTKLVRKRVPFLKNPPEFWTFMAPKVIRRTYEDPLFKKTLTANGRMMPKADVKKLVCPMDAHQAALMLASIKDFKATFEKMTKEADKKGQQLNSTLVISQMTTMRISSTCPEMLNEKFGKEIYKGKAGGGKMKHIHRIVEDAIKKEGKVLILSDFHVMHNSVYDSLCGGTKPLLKKSQVIKFLTSWDDDTRRENFDSFQSNEDVKVFIAGTRAIREGVDLSAADTVICCDLLWSPAFQTQAWSRVMAPQTRERTCDIYILVSQNSLDEHIYNVFYSKMVAAEQALDRKVGTRRAREIDIRWFVERILDEEMSIQTYMRDAGSETIYLPQLNLADFDERIV